MQDNYSFSNLGAEKYTCNSFGSLQSQLKKTISKSLGVRLTKVGPNRHHPTGQHDVPGCKRVRQIKNLLLHRFTLVNDCEVHQTSI